MSDLIERDKAIEKLKENVVGMGGDDFSETGVHIDDIESVINSIPSARPKGEWISEGRTYPPTNAYNSAYCSHCGEWSEYLTDYCGNCGADMRGDNDGKDIQSADEQ